VVDVKRDVTVEEVSSAFMTAASGPLQGVLDFTTEPLVSIDFNTNPHSAIIDGLSTIVMEGRKIKVLAWYDNEWGYSCRVVDLVQIVASKMKRLSAV
jgi:glyceraldehyde 3-phosphate dehydrogenase